MVEKVEFNPRDDNLGSAVVDRPDMNTARMEDIGTAMFYLNDTLKSDSSNFPVEITDGITVTDYSPSLASGTTMNMKLAPEQAKCFWTELTGNTVGFPEELPKGLLVLTWTKYNLDATQVKMYPIGDQSNLLASVEYNKVLRDWRYAGGEASKNIFASVSDNMQDADATLRMASVVSNLVVGSIGSIQQAIETRKAELALWEREKSLDIYDLDDRKIINPGEIVRLATSADRKPLFLVVDFGQGIPQPYLAALDFLKGGYERLALCPIREDGTIDGGEIIYDHGPGRGSNSLRTFVLIGNYNPDKPIPEAQMLGSQSRNSKMALPSQEIRELPESSEEYS